MQASWVARSAGLLVDHVAKGSMLGWLLAWPALQPLFLYAWHFYGSPSTCRGLTRRGRRTRSDKRKARNRVTVNPLCQHSIPRCSTKLCPQLQGQVREARFLGLLEILGWCLYDALALALWDRTRVQHDEGKSRIGNAAGEKPRAYVSWKRCLLRCFPRIPRCDAKRQRAIAFAFAVTTTGHSDYCHNNNCNHLNIELQHIKLFQSRDAFIGACSGRPKLWARWRASFHLRNVVIAPLKSCADGSCRKYR